jgi:hypothetical protein
MVSPCWELVGLNSAPVDASSTFRHLPSRNWFKMLPVKTTLEQPHPLPPAWTSCLARS